MTYMWCVRHGSFDCLLVQCRNLFHEEKRYIRQQKDHNDSELKHYQSAQKAVYKEQKVATKRVRHACVCKIPMECSLYISLPASGRGRRNPARGRVPPSRYLPQCFAMLCGRSLIHGVVAETLPVRGWGGISPIWVIAPVFCRCSPRT